MLSQVGELSVSETAHTFHCKQGHGNNRCYITNKGDVTLFYCHHCGGKGMLREKLSYYKASIKPPTVVPPSTYYLPTDGVEIMASWPVNASLWLSKAGIGQKDVDELGIIYSPYINCVCIPINFNGAYQGYVARTFTDGMPKYIARRNNRDEFIFTRRGTNSKIVLCEDILSCYNVNKLFPSLSSMALLGTSLSPPGLSYILECYDEYIIWLDDDKPEVKMRQLKLKQQLSLYSSNVTIVTSPLDPKYIPKEEMEEILHDYL